jgi:hypothetical protein
VKSKNKTPDKKSSANSATVDNESKSPVTQNTSKPPVTNEDQSTGTTPRGKRNEPDSGFSPPPLSQDKRQLSLPDIFGRSELEVRSKDINESVIEATLTKCLQNPEVYGRFVSAITQTLEKNFKKNFGELNKTVNNLEKNVSELRSEHELLRSMCGR